jgi:hypothetical protein
MVSVALTACVEDMGDAADDAVTGEVDPASAPVASPAVHVRVDDPNAASQPDQGVTLLVHDRGGRLVGREQADGDGRAVLDVPVGGSVTALQTDSRLTTIFDVQAGDDLVFSNLNAAPGAPAEVLVHIPTHPTVTRPSVYASCGRVTTESPGLYRVQGSQSCGGKTDVLVVATLGNGGLEYVARAGVPLPGPTVNLDGPYQPVPTVAVTLHRASSERVDLVVTSSLRASGNGWLWYEVSRNVSLTGTDQIVALPYVPGVGDAQVLTVKAPFKSYRRVVRGAPAPFQVDVATTTAAISKPRFDGRGVRWAYRTAVPADGVRVAVIAKAFWALLAPPGTVALLLPELPPDLAPMVSLANPSAVVTAYDSSLTEGWTGFRQGGYLDPEGELHGDAALIDVVTSTSDAVSQ